MLNRLKECSSKMKIAQYIFQLITILFALNGAIKPIAIYNLKI